MKTAETRRARADRASKRIGSPAIVPQLAMTASQTAVDSGLLDTSAAKSRTRRRAASTVLVGIDTGGTFTDLVALVDGQVRIHKLLSTPDDPARAVIEGIRALLGEARADLVTYSTTVATNALLERKGARIALFTDAGFEDLIEIGRQNRTDLYALAPFRPEPLVARRMRFGVGGRTFFDGRIEKPLGRRDLAVIRRLAERSGAQAFAVCLLHSYANSRSEEAVARVLEPLGLPLSVSHRLLPEYREYERLSTTVTNAYVAPRMAAHLERLERDLAGSRLRVMQSNASAIGPRLARLEAVRTLLSGPAAGVAGAAGIMASAGVDRFITFDMGGTSTDVALFDRGAHIRTLSYPGGYAVRSPAIDMHTVGAGGGSIASIDAGGSLQVGPESAGADPGPACYGRGERATVTDANLVAGRLLAANFLGGRMRLHPDRAERALDTLGRAMKADAARGALGVLRVVNANMERAVRVISVERGFDPREFALVAFGGAGPMHACELAAELGIRHVILPRNPGLLCAWGALCAPLGREYSATLRDHAPSYRRLTERAKPMLARAERALLGDGASRSAIRHELWTDVRYRGQSYEIEVRLTPNFVGDFHGLHQRTFGHSSPKEPVEVVNLRLRSHARQASVQPPLPLPGAARRPAPLATTNVLTESGSVSAPVFARDALGEGTTLKGPLIVAEMSTTGYVAADFTLRVDGFGNLHLET